MIWIILSFGRALKESGGITDYSDLSNIQIIRKIPYGKGGGKKTAFIDFTNYLNDPSFENDIRLFDGDKIIVSKSSS